MPMRGAKLALVVCQRGCLPTAATGVAVSKKLAVVPRPGVGGGLISQRSPYVAVRRREMRQASSTNREASRKIAEANCGEVEQRSSAVPQLCQKLLLVARDRKSTRLNSSHLGI